MLSVVLVIKQDVCSSNLLSNESDVYIIGSQLLLKASTSKLHEEVGQMIFTPVKMMSDGKCVPGVLWCVLCDRLTEMQKTRAWFTVDSSCYTGTNRSG